MMKLFFVAVMSMASMSSMALTWQIEMVDSNEVKKTAYLGDGEFALRMPAGELSNCKVTSTLKTKTSEIRSIACAAQSGEKISTGLSCSVISPFFQSIPVEIEIPGEDWAFVTLSCR